MPIYNVQLTKDGAMALADKLGYESVAGQDLIAQIGGREIGDRIAIAGTCGEIYDAKVLADDHGYFISYSAELDDGDTAFIRADSIDPRIEC